MIFRSRKSKSQESDATTTAVAPDRGNGHHEGGDERTAEAVLAEIDGLVERNRAGSDSEIERRIIALRHQAGMKLTEGEQAPSDHPNPDFDQLPDGGGLPEFTAEQLTPELLRAGMLRDGCLLVRGVMGPDEATAIAEQIERVMQARASGSGEPGMFEEFAPAPQFDLAAERAWITHGGGFWAADSPRVMFEVLERLERAGLRDLITAYLGERPVISVNKCTMRKVDPDAGNAWHQDGAFLGDVRALNVWLSLSHCGDTAPGMAIVPRRLEEIVPTGTEGAIFDWSVSPAVAEQAAAETEIIQPIFEPGDVLLFDDLFLHRTAADPAMPNSRYAVESWFFGPTGFPSEYAPIAF